MSGSNWWILLTFPALHFYVCVSVCVCILVCVCVPQVAAQVMYVTICPLIRSSSEGAPNTVSLCNVTNWADPVREEDMGINGVSSDTAACVKTIPLRSALPPAH